MKPLSLSFCIMLTIASVGQMGCSHTPERSDALSPSIRANLGTIGVVSARYDPKIELKEPMDKGTGALTGAGASALAWLEVAGSMGQGGILLVPFTPLAAAAGAIAGTSKGVSPEKVREADASIKAAVKNLTIPDTLQDRLLEIVQKQTSHLLVRIEAQGPISPEQRISYRSLSRRGMDSILEIGVTACNLEGPGFKPDIAASHVNSDLWVSMDVRVRLVRIVDDAELYTHSFTTKCYGQRLKFLEWADNDAQLFREEVTACLSSVAERIVDDVFKAFCDLSGQWMFLIQTGGTETGEISGNLIIRNRGNLNAPPSLVRFYLSDDAKYDEGKDPLLREVPVKKIRGGEGQPIGLDYHLSIPQDVRRKYVIAIIDAENMVAESDKENNYVVGVIE